MQWHVHTDPFLEGEKCARKEVVQNLSRVYLCSCFLFKIICNKNASFLYEERNSNDRWFFHLGFRDPML